MKNLNKILWLRLYESWTFFFFFKYTDQLLAITYFDFTGFKPYSCPVCKQEFSRKYHLVRHNMQTGCDGKEKPVFPCQVCLVHISFYGIHYKYFCIINLFYY